MLHALLLIDGCLLSLIFFALFLDLSRKVQHHEALQRLVQVVGIRIAHCVLLSANRAVVHAFPMSLDQTSDTKDVPALQANGSPSDS